MTAALPETTPDKDATAGERPLFDVFAGIAAGQPNHLAVDDGMARLSYAELRDRALALGARVAAEVPVDGLVGVLVPTTTLYPIAWFACLAARRPFLPFDPHLPPARIQAIITEAGLAAVIIPNAASDLAASLPAGLPRIPMVAEPGSEPANLPACQPPAKVGMVVFTSGSTGRAKGIALHERSPLANAMNYRVSCDLGPDDRLLSLHPPSTDAGMRDTFAALLSGISLHLVNLKRDGLARVLERLRDDGITICTAVPAVTRALLAMDGAAAAFKRLRIIRLSGDAVMGSDIAALGRLLAPTARVMVSFGMTETGRTLLQRLIDPHAPIEVGRVAVGTPAPGQTVSVEDANGIAVRPGETGELVIRGRYLALGYWIGGRLDPTGFPAVPSTHGIRCYRSGDLVQLRADGMFVPIGRADRQVKINGMRVEPGDTEVALRGLPGVADAAVVVHGDAGTQVLVAFVVPAPGEPAADPSRGSTKRAASQYVLGLRAALATLLPPQQVPARIRLVPAIPLLPSLKPDLAALRALLAADATPGLLRSVWARLRRAGRVRGAQAAER